MVFFCSGFAFFPLSTVHFFLISLLCPLPHLFPPLCLSSLFSTLFIPSLPSSFLSLSQFVPFLIFLHPATPRQAGGSVFWPQGRNIPRGKTESSQQVSVATHCPPVFLLQRRSQSFSNSYYWGILIMLMSANVERDMHAFWIVVSSSLSTYITWSVVLSAHSVNVYIVVAYTAL